VKRYLTSLFGLFDIIGIFFFATRLTSPSVVGRSSKLGSANLRYDSAKLWKDLDVFGDSVFFRETNMVN